MTPVPLAILDIELFERTMPFVHPFRFGSATVVEAPQAFVRATIEVEGHGRSVGAAAEMMMPKWFDKDPAKSPGRTVDDLRASLSVAAAHYRSAKAPDTAFGHHARVVGEPDRSGRTALAAQYGPAVIDKAILDALCKALGADAASALACNAPGLDARLTPDLDDPAIEAFLRALKPPSEIAIRWTVGLLDDLDGLAAQIAEDRLRFLKIKLGGDVGADLDRLGDLAGRLADAAPDMHLTLDANEQYDDARLADLLRALERDRRLAFVRERLLYLEQPFDRAATFEHPLGPVGEAVDVIIDEADAGYDAFPRAIALGYRGVSSKSCKGLYKSLLNTVRAKTRNAERTDRRPLFVAAEDLTCQAGLGVEQDTALAAILGVGHMERNGHHYVDGFAGAPEAEAERFAAAHPGLYRLKGRRRVLDTRSGTLPTASLFSRPGFAGGAEPDWSTLAPLRVATTPMKTPA